MQSKRKHLSFSFKISTIALKKQITDPSDRMHSIIKADFDSTVKSTIWTGRPLRALATPYVRHWETERAQEIKDLTSQGIIPLYHEFEKLEKENGLTEEIEDQSTLR